MLATSKAAGPFLRASGLFALLGINCASAEDKLGLPRYDTVAYCSTSDLSNVSRDGCLKGEESMRAKLATEWSAYPFQKRHFCVTSVRLLPKAQRSYSMLHGCLVEQGVS
ncbi:hypothetical protein ABEG18_03380 [Alsobacter sp. KACC 23698]|uniref:Uncharacterized protein n=1 Tax=Alsobacter sp. KACC 23698 TaxID=3149229 RepID=A0AAU7JI20_9HYPH